MQTQHGSMFTFIILISSSSQTQSYEIKLPLEAFIDERP